MPIAATVLCMLARVIVPRVGLQAIRAHPPDEMGHDVSPPVPLEQRGVTLATPTTNPVRLGRHEHRLNMNA